MNPSQLYNIKEVCEILKMSRRTVYKQITSGELNAINTGDIKKSYRVPQAEIERWIDSKTMRVNPSIEYARIDPRWKLSNKKTQKQPSSSERN